MARKIVLIIVLAIGLATVSTFSIRKMETPETKTRFDHNIETYSKLRLPAPGIGQKVYSNLLLKFSLLYPDNLTKREYSDGDTSTIVFEDKDRGEGFQIFIVPHEGAEVSAERFKMDVPSGVMKEPQNIFVDGVPAQKFYSQNQIVGETVEVWFIYEGLLYEVTAPKVLEQWLSEILRSWSFMKL